ncbi:hypothetical protein [Alkalisalibacterium limincola]|uniref:Exo-alpha-sialidase n=1 Tax=Alkalisalibacterium limincola TaxID=2699169 RepID=A0A5C8KX16_9GAMM|nr:hypothetical protein [Alkalisalibacterium limincola]TXK65588.1 hypothetical protein FU658_00150 [Alkalisalibacterium limincola]
MNAWTRGAATRGGCFIGLLGVLLVAGTAQAQRMDRSAPHGDASERAAGPQPQETETTPWQGVSLWRGEGMAVALSPTLPGWAAATVDHQLAWDQHAAVYFSDDFGAQWDWARINDQRGTPSPGALHFLPNGRLVSGGVGVVNRKTSPSSTWSGSGIGFQDSHAHQIASSRVDGTPLIVAVRAAHGWPGGIVRGGQFGIGFIDITPTGFDDHDGTAVAMHATNIDRMAAALVSPLGVVSVMQSLDGGGSWQNLTSGLPAGGQVTALTYVGDRLLAAVDGRGVYSRASGAGTAWTQVGGASAVLHRVHRLHVAHANPQRVFAATASGLSTSHDGGLSWRHAAIGTAGLDVRGVDTTPLDPDLVLLAVAGVGTMASVDGGASFEANAQGIADAVVDQVAAHPTRPLQLAATVQHNGRWRLVESFDGGEGWVMARGAPGDIAQLWFDPEGGLWATTHGPDDARPLHRRLASGQWRRVELHSLHAVHTLAFDPGTPGLVWAGGVGSVHGMRRAVTWSSTDGGDAWWLEWIGPAFHAVASIGLMPGTSGQQLLVSTRNLGGGMPAQLRISLNGGGGYQSIEGTPAGDWSSIEMCTHAGNGGTAVLHFRMEPDGEPPYTLRGQDLEQIASGGEWVYEGGLYQGLLGAPVCHQEGDTLQVYTLLEGSNDSGMVVLRPTSAGNLAAYGEWDFDAKRPSRAHALAFNDSGVYLASNRGLFRNTAPVQADAPQFTNASSVDGRAQRIVSLAWTAGGEWVDVLRDGEVVASLRNSGSFSERLLRDGSAPEYQVCNRFGEGCSETVTLAP